MKILCLMAMLPFIISSPAHAASSCDDYRTELDGLGIKLAQIGNRLAEAERHLEAAQNHLDVVSNAMATMLAGGRYSTMDSLVLIRYCKSAIRPVGTLNPAQALPCINKVLGEITESKRGIAKTVEEIRAEDRRLRTRLFQLRELQAAAGCTTAKAAPGTGTAPGAGSAADSALPPRNTSTLCAEKWKGLRMIRVRLDNIRSEYNDWARELAQSEREMDRLTQQAALVPAGNWSQISDARILACAGYFDAEKITPEKLSACIGRLIGVYLKEVRQKRQVLEGLRDKDREARREASTIRDIAAEMKCPEPPPLGVPPLPEPTPLKEPKPATAPAPAAPAATPPPTLSAPAVTATPDAAAFVGKWTGTITITAASDPSIVGISETGTLEIVAAGKGVGIKTRLGIIGDPAGYQTTVSGNHLKVHYVGPSHTTATPGIPATLDYTLDVTLNGNRLTGESQSKATSTHAGQTAVVSFTQKMDLQR